MDQPAVACPTAHARGAGVLAAFTGGDEQLDGLSDQRAVVLERDPLLQLDQPLVSFLHNGLGQLIGEFGRRRAGALGVLEGERRREPGLLDHVKSGREVLFGLTGETDYQIGGDRGVRHGSADSFDDAQIAFGAVGAPHRAQYPIRPGLQRHVQRRADVRCLCHRLDDVVGELGGMRRGEPDPLQARYVAAGAQQLGESTPVARYRRVGEGDAVGVDVLSQQGDLENSGRPPATAPRPRCRPGCGRPLCPAATGRCRTYSCCCSPPRWKPKPHRGIRGHSAATTEIPVGPRRSPPEPRCCAGPARARWAVTRCCGCRTPRRPTAPCAARCHGPSGPGSRRPQSACRDCCACAAPGD